LPPLPFALLPLCYYFDYCICFCFCFCYYDKSNNSYDKSNNSYDKSKKCKANVRIKTRSLTEAREAREAREEREEREERGKGAAPSGLWPIGQRQQQGWCSYFLFNQIRIKTVLILIRIQTRIMSFVVRILSFF